MIRHREDTDARDGRLTTTQPYGNFPFYVKPTVWNRWGPEAWVVWLAGGKLPGDSPKEYLADGFKYSDLGPRNLMGKGEDTMEAEIMRLKGLGRGGCPFG